MSNDHFGKFVPVKSAAVAAPTYGLFSPPSGRWQNFVGRFGSRSNIVLPLLLSSGKIASWSNSRPAINKFPPASFSRAKNSSLPGGNTTCPAGRPTPGKCPSTFARDASTCATGEVNTCMYGRGEFARRKKCTTMQAREPEVHKTIVHWPSGQKMATVHKPNDVSSPSMYVALRMHLPKQMGTLFVR